MNLYIEIENYTPKNHPAFEDNLIQAFGAIPDNWEQFVRVEQPTPKTYEVFDSQYPTYAKVNGIWTDVWILREMTNEEKLAKQQAVRDEFFDREQSENWAAWVLDEETCTMQPPIPKPEPDPVKLEAGILTTWCGVENGWKDTPPRPFDDKQYKFDFVNWQWVLLEN